MNTQHTHTAVEPTSPALIKKVEKEILKEAKHEEKSLKHAIKDLSHTQKAENHATKADNKAVHTLEKTEKKEQNALKSLHQATNQHDVALSGVHKAQNDAEAISINHVKMTQTLQEKQAQVDAAMKAHDEHTAARNAKLAALHGPAGGDEASRVIAQHGPPV
ncbi:hypothetical protein B0H34DRAFT_671044 [Crassisporium funariophilum]|nr:hypothetical protein B0H34DRAFT_671044 [Crassisporium funariophilum]